MTGLRDNDLCMGLQAVLTSDLQQANTAILSATVFGIIDSALYDLPSVYSLGLYKSV
jgi:hypothetical protein